MTTVLCECVGCGARREINPGEVAPDDVPMCNKCFMPMVAVSATTKEVRHPAGRKRKGGGA